MITFIEKKRCAWPFRLISFFIILTFSSSLIMPVPQVRAQTILNLPIPGAMVPMSPAFMPTLIKGLKIHPENPLEFDFIVTGGDDKFVNEELKSESEKLIKYFLAALTTPEDELWVNLSPHEPDRIIPDDFSTTDMGKDLLSQDYLLKQLTASLIYPEDELGQKFWDRVHKKVYELYGTVDVPMSTFNKVWIVPDNALIYEKGDTAFVMDSRLKVMLEEDYVALDENLKTQSKDIGQISESKRREMSSVTSEIVKEIIIPEIEREVNNGKNFANLRQIYNAMLLAAWFKNTLKESLLGQVYADRNKTAGIDIKDKSIKDKIYRQYMEAYRKGVYSYIKEDFDPATKQMIPKKYFSGGFHGGEIGRVASNVVSDLALVSGEVLEKNQRSGPVYSVNTRVAEPGEEVRILDSESDDAAMVAGDVEIIEPLGYPIKAVVFDWDGVVQHSLDIIIEAEIPLWVKYIYGDEPTALEYSYVDDYIRTNLDSLIELFTWAYEERRKAGKLPIEISFEKAYERFQKEYGAMAIAAYQDKEDVWQDEMPLFRGITSLINSLQDRNIDISVVTNLIEVAHEVRSQVTGIAHQFRVMYGSESSRLDPGENVKLGGLQRAYNHVNKATDETILRREVAIIEDSATNIRLAVREGYTAIGVASDAEHANKLKEAGAHIVIYEDYRFTEEILWALGHQDAMLESLIDVTLEHVQQIMNFYIEVGGLNAVFATEKRADEVRTPRVDAAMRIGHLFKRGRITRSDIPNRIIQELVNNIRIFEGETALFDLRIIKAVQADSLKTLEILYEDGIIDRDDLIEYVDDGLVEFLKTFGYEGTYVGHWLLAVIGSGYDDVSQLRASEREQLTERFVHFRSIDRTQAWGGDLIQRWTSRHKPVDPSTSQRRPLSETVEFSFHPKFTSTASVPSNRLAGDKLVRITDLEPIANEVFGPEIIARYGRTKLPLMTKYLDAGNDLSIQVHPSTEVAAQLGESDQGKEEIFFIMDAEEDSEFILGLKEGVRREQLEQILQKPDLSKDDLREYLNFVKVKPGEIYRVPPGTIHALGAGIRVVELSTPNSDITYRLFDYQRARQDQSRPLHLDKGLAAVNFDTFRGDALVNSLKREWREVEALPGNGLIETVDLHPNLLVERLTLDPANPEAFIESETDGRFHFIMMTGGWVHMRNLRHSDNFTPLHVGSSVLVPANMGRYKIQRTPPFSEPVEILRVTLRLARDNKITSRQDDLLSVPDGQFRKIVPISNSKKSRQSKLVSERKPRTLQIVSSDAAMVGEDADRREILEGWRGRTYVINNGDGTAIGVKFVRNENEIEDLSREEREMGRWSGQGLDAPEVIAGVGVYSGQFGAIEEFPDEVLGERIALVYRAPLGYFEYLTDNLSTRRQGLDYGRSFSIYERAAKKNLKDLTVLYSKGYYHSSLTPLTHSNRELENGVRSNKWLWGYKPMGLIQELKAKVSYSNLRLSGLGDFEHVVPMSRYASYYDIIGQNLSEFIINVAYGALNNDFTVPDTYRLIERLVQDFFVLMEVPENNILQRIEPDIREFVRLFSEQWESDILLSKAWVRPTLNHLVSFVAEISREVSSGSPFAQQYGGDYSILRLPRSTKTEQGFRPTNVVISQDGSRFYVTDRGNNKIHIFDGQNRSYIRSFGSRGSGEGQFARDFHLFLSPDGTRIYVADPSNERIQIFDPDGKFVALFDIKDQAEGRFWPRRVVPTPNQGNIFVINPSISGGVLYIFDKEGKIIRAVPNYKAEERKQGFSEIVLSPNGREVYAIDDGLIRIFDFQGNEKGRIGSQNREDILFKKSSTLKFNNTGNRLYVIQPNGDFAKEIQIFEENPGRHFSRYVNTFSVPTVQRTQFNLSFGNNGEYLYFLNVNSEINNYFDVYTKDGIYITSMGSTGYEEGQFRFAHSPVFGQDETLYVADPGIYTDDGHVTVITPKQGFEDLGLQKAGGVDAAMVGEDSAERMSLPQLIGLTGILGIMLMAALPMLGAEVNPEMDRDGLTVNVTIEEGDTREIIIAAVAEVIDTRLDREQVTQFIAENEGAGLLTPLRDVRPGDVVDLTPLAERLMLFDMINEATIISEKSVFTDGTPLSVHFGTLDKNSKYAGKRGMALEGHAFINLNILAEMLNDLETDTAELEGILLSMINVYKSLFNGESYLQILEGFLRETVFHESIHVLAEAMLENGEREEFISGFLNDFDIPDDAYYRVRTELASFLAQTVASLYPKWLLIHKNALSLQEPEYVGASSEYGIYLHVGGAFTRLLLGHLNYVDYIVGQRIAEEETARGQALDQAARDRIAAEVAAGYAQDGIGYGDPKHYEDFLNSLSDDEIRSAAKVSYENLFGTMPSTEIISLFEQEIERAMQFLADGYNFEGTFTVEKDQPPEEMSPEQEEELIRDLEKLLSEEESGGGGDAAMVGDSGSPKDISRRKMLTYLGLGTAAVIASGSLMMKVQGYWERMEEESLQEQREREEARAAEDASIPDYPEEPNPIPLENRIRDLDVNEVTSRMTFLFGRTKQQKEVVLDSGKFESESFPGEEKFLALMIYYNLMEFRSVVNEILQEDVDRSIGSDAVRRVLREKYQEALEASSAEGLRQKAQRTKTSQGQFNLFAEVLPSLARAFVSMDQKLERQEFLSFLELNGVEVMLDQYPEVELFPDVWNGFGTFADNHWEVTTGSSGERFKELSEKLGIVNEKVLLPNQLYAHPTFFFRSSFGRGSRSWWLTKVVQQFEFAGREVFIAEKLRNDRKLFGEYGFAMPNAPIMILPQMRMDDARRFLDTVRGRRAYHMPVSKDEDVQTEIDRHITLLFLQGVQDHPELLDERTLLTHLYLSIVLHEFGHAIGGHRLAEEFIPYLTELSYGFPYSISEYLGLKMMKGSSWIATELLGPLVGERSRQAMFSTQRRLDVLERLRKMDSNEIQRKAREMLRKSAPEVWQAFESEEGRRFRAKTFEALSAYAATASAEFLETQVQSDAAMVGGEEPGEERRPDPDIERRVDQMASRGILPSIRERSRFRKTVAGLALTGAALGAFALAFQLWDTTPEGEDILPDFNLEITIEVPEVVDLDISDVEKLSGVAQLMVDVPKLEGEQHYQFYRISEGGIYFTNFDRLAEQGKMYDRLAIFSEAPEYAGQVLADEALQKAKESLGKRHVWAGHNYSSDTLALFFSMAYAQGIELNDYERALEAFLLVEGFMVETQPGVYVAEPNMALVSITQDPNVGFNARLDIAEHEVHHGMYFVNPQFRKDLNDFWNNNVTPEEEDVVKSFLVAQGYNINDHDLVVREFAAHYRDMYAMLSMHKNAYARFMGGRFWSQSFESESREEAMRDFFGRAMVSSKSTFYYFQYEQVMEDPEAFVDETGEVLLSKARWKRVALTDSYYDSLERFSTELMKIEDSLFQAPVATYSPEFGWVNLNLKMPSDEEELQVVVTLKPLGDPKVMWAVAPEGVPIVQTAIMQEQANITLDAVDGWITGKDKEVQERLRERFKGFRKQFPGAKRVAITLNSFSGFKIAEDNFSIVPDNTFNIIMLPGDIYDKEGSDSAKEDTEDSDSAMVGGDGEGFVPGESSSVDRMRSEYRDLAERELSYIVGRLGIDEELGARYRTDTIYGARHAENLMANALRIADHLQASEHVDWRVLAAAIALHGIVVDEIDYAALDFEYVTDFLTRLGSFDRRQIQHVLEIVALHDQHDRNGLESREALSLESQILYDVNQLDFFGTYGIYRSLMIYLNKGRSLEYIRAHMLEDLESRFVNLAFEVSQQLSSVDFATAHAFARRLRDETFGIEYLFGATGVVHYLDAYADENPSPFILFITTELRLSDRRDEEVSDANFTEGYFQDLRNLLFDATPLELLWDIREVGAKKAVGFVRLKDDPLIERLIDDLAEEAESRGLRTLFTDEDETGWTRLYVYDPVSLDALLNDSRGVLVESGLPITPDEFMAFIRSNIVDDLDPSFSVIDRAFTYQSSIENEREAGEQLRRWEKGGQDPGRMARAAVAQLPETMPVSEGISLREEVGYYRSQNGKQYILTDEKGANLGIFDVLANPQGAAVDGFAREDLQGTGIGFLVILALRRHIGNMVPLVADADSYLAHNRKFLSAQGLGPIVVRGEEEADEEKTTAPRTEKPKIVLTQMPQGFDARQLRIAGFNEGEFSSSADRDVEQLISDFIATNTIDGLDRSLALQDVLTELIANSQYRSAGGLLRWQAYFYQAREGQPQTNVLRIRLLQDGLAQDEYWDILNVSAENFDRQGARGPNFLTDVEERRTQGLVVNGAGGLAYIGYLMQATDVYLQYERLADGNVMTDLWVHVDPLVEEHGEASDAAMVSSPLIVYPKNTETGRMYDIRDILTSPLFADKTRLDLSEGEHTVVNVGIGAMPLDTIELSDALKYVNDRVQIIGTELPGLLAKAWISSPALLERFRREINRALRVSDHGSLVNVLQNVYLSVNEDDRIIEAIAEFQVNGGRVGYVTLAVAPDVTLMGNNGEPQLANRNSDLFESFVDALGKQKINRLIRGGIDAADPDGMRIQFYPARSKLEKAGARLAVTDDLVSYGIAEASVIVSNNVTHYMNAKGQDEFRRKLGESLGENGILVIKTKIAIPGLLGEVVNDIEIYQKQGTSGGLKSLGKIISGGSRIFVEEAQGFFGGNLSRRMQVVDRLLETAKLSREDQSKIRAAVLGEASDPITFLVMTDQQFEDIAPVLVSRIAAREGFRLPDADSAMVSQWEQISDEDLNAMLAGLDEPVELSLYTEDITPAQPAVFEYEQHGPVILAVQPEIDSKDIEYWRLVKDPDTGEFLLHRVRPLRQGFLERSSLLVFDNLSEDEEIRELLPGKSLHLASLEISIEPRAQNDTVVRFTNLGSRQKISYLTDFNIEQRKSLSYQVSEEDWNAVESIFAILENGIHVRKMLRKNPSQQIMSLTLLSRLRDQIRSWGTLDEEYQEALIGHFMIFFGWKDGNRLESRDWLRRFFRIYHHIFYLSTDEIAESYLLGRVQEYVPVGWRGFIAQVYVEPIYTDMHGGIAPILSQDEVIIISDDNFPVSDHTIAEHETQHMFDMIEFAQHGLEYVTRGQGDAEYLTQEFRLIDDWEFEYTAYLKTLILVGRSLELFQGRRWSIFRRDEMASLVDSVFGGTAVFNGYMLLGEEQHSHVRALNELQRDFAGEILERMNERDGLGRPLTAERLREMDRGHRLLRWETMRHRAPGRIIKEVAQEMLNRFYLDRIGYVPNYPDLADVRPIRIQPPTTAADAAMVGEKELRRRWSKRGITDEEIEDILKYSPDPERYRDYYSYETGIGKIREMKGAIKGPVILALSGGAAAGKSYLADRLGRGDDLGLQEDEIFVLHGDNFGVKYPDIPHVVAALTKALINPRIKFIVYEGIWKREVFSRVRDLLGNHQIISVELGSVANSKGESYTHDRTFVPPINIADRSSPQGQRHLRNLRRYIEISDTPFMGLDAIPFYNGPGGVYLDLPMDAKHEAQVIADVMGGLFLSSANTWIYTRKDVRGYELKRGDDILTTLISIWQEEIYGNTDRFPFPREVVIEMITPASALHVIEYADGSEEYVFVENFGSADAAMVGVGDASSTGPIENDVVKIRYGRFSNPAAEERQASGVSSGIPVLDKLSFDRKGDSLSDELFAPALYEFVQENEVQEVLQVEVVGDSHVYFMVNDMDIQGNRAEVTVGYHYVDSDGALREGSKVFYVLAETEDRGYSLDEIRRDILFKLDDLLVSTADGIVSDGIAFKDAARIVRYLDRNGEEQRIVYKPVISTVSGSQNTLYTESFIQNLLKNLGYNSYEIDLREGYGWIEFVDNFRWDSFLQTGAADAAVQEEVYDRADLQTALSIAEDLGHWAAVEYLLNNQDVHQENLIVKTRPTEGNNVVIIDHDVIFTAKEDGLASYLSQRRFLERDIPLRIDLPLGTLPSLGFGQLLGDVLIKFYYAFHYPDSFRAIEENETQLREAFLRGFKEGSQHLLAESGAIKEFLQAIDSSPLDNVIIREVVRNTGYYAGAIPHYSLGVSKEGVRTGIEERLGDLEALVEGRVIPRWGDDFQIMFMPNPDQLRRHLPLSDDDAADAAMVGSDDADPLDFRALLDELVRVVGGRNSVKDLSPDDPYERYLIKLLDVDHPGADRHLKKVERIKEFVKSLQLENESVRSRAEQLLMLLALVGWGIQSRETVQLQDDFVVIVKDKLRDKMGIREGVNPETFAELAGYFLLLEVGDASRYVHPGMILIKGGQSAAEVDSAIASEMQHFILDHEAQGIRVGGDVAEIFDAISIFFDYSPSAFIAPNDFMQTLVSLIEEKSLDQLRAETVKTQEWFRLLLEFLPETVVSTFQKNLKETIEVRLGETKREFLKRNPLAVLSLIRQIYPEEARALGLGTWIIQERKQPISHPVGIVLADRFAKAAGRLSGKEYDGVLALRVMARIVEEAKEQAKEDPHKTYLRDFESFQMRFNQLVSDEVLMQRLKRALEGSMSGFQPGLESLRRQREVRLRNAAADAAMVGGDIPALMQKVKLSSAEGKRLLDEGRIAEAESEFGQAVEAFMKIVQGMRTEPYFKKVNKVDLEQFARLAEIENPFHPQVKNLDLKIQTENDLREFLMGGLLLGVDYFRRTGPDISGMPGRVYGEIEDGELPVINSAGLRRVEIYRGQITASETYEYRDGDREYIIKFLGPRNVTELLGQRWFRHLGFSVVDTKVVDVGERKAVIMKKIPNVIPLYDYMGKKLPLIEMFDPGVVVRRLLPDGYSKLLMDSKLADIVIESKDAHLRNFLLRVDERGELLAEPPIFIDKEESFGFRSKIVGGPKYQPYRGAFAQAVLETGAETNILFGEPYYHRQARHRDLEAVAVRIGRVQRADIEEIVVDVLREFEESEYSADFKVDILVPRWMAAIESVRNIFDLPVLRDAAMVGDNLSGRNPDYSLVGGFTQRIQSDLGLLVGPPFVARQASQAADRIIARIEALAQTPEFSHFDSTGLHPVYIAQDMAVKNVVNPRDELLVAVYGGAGADISNFLLSTNATEGYFVDIINFNVGEFKRYKNERWKREIPAKIRTYLQEKRPRGFAHYGTLGRGDIYMAVMTELQALGIRGEDVRVDKIKGKDDKMHARLRFKWTYPGTNEEKEYKITMIGGVDITKPDEYPDFLKRTLKKGIDLYYQRAGSDVSHSIANFYSTFMPVIARSLRPGGFTVTDDSLQSGGKAFLGRMLAPLGFVFESPKEVESPLMLWWEQIKPARNVDDNDYGRRVDIRKIVSHPETSDAAMVGGTVPSLPGSVRARIQRPIEYAAFDMDDSLTAGGANISLIASRLLEAWVDLKTIKAMSIITAGDIEKVKRRVQSRLRNNVRERLSRVGENGGVIRFPLKGGETSADWVDSLREKGYRISEDGTELGGPIISLKDHLGDQDYRKLVKVADKIRLELSLSPDTNNIEYRETMIAVFEKNDVSKRQQIRDKFIEYLNEEGLLERLKIAMTSVAVDISVMDKGEGIEQWAEVIALKEGSSVEEVLARTMVVGDSEIDVPMLNRVAQAGGLSVWVGHHPGTDMDLDAGVLIIDTLYGEEANLAVLNTHVDWVRQSRSESDAAMVGGTESADDPLKLLNLRIPGHYNEWIVVEDLRSAGSHIVSLSLVNALELDGAERDWAYDRLSEWDDGSVKLSAFLKEIKEGLQSNNQSLLRTVYFALSQEGVEGYFQLKNDELYYIEVNPINRDMAEQDRRFRGIGWELIVAAFYKLLKANNKAVEVTGPGKVMRETLRRMYHRYIGQEYLLPGAWVYTDDEVRQIINGQSRRIAEEMLGENQLMIATGRLTSLVGIAATSFNGEVILGVKKETDSDPAMVAETVATTKPPVFGPESYSGSEVGGIDLNPAHVILQIKRDENGVPLPVNHQEIEKINIQGLVPVIINITPMQALPFLMGEAPQNETQQLSFIDRYQNYLEPERFALSRKRYNSPQKSNKL